MCLQQLLKNRAARRKNHFVSLDTLIFTGQGHISEVIVIPQFLKRCLSLVLEIIPLQAKLLICHDFKNSRLSLISYQWSHFKKILPGLPFSVSVLMMLDALTDRVAFLRSCFKIKMNWSNHILKGSSTKKFSIA